jgi:DNA-directed RNA polymerase
MSNSSYQIIAGLTFDPDLAMHTNLVDTQHPQDFYTFILERFRTELDRSINDASGPEKKKLIEIRDSGSITRPNFKRIIMTIPYGITRYGIIRNLKECGVPHPTLVYSVWGKLDQYFAAYKTIHNYLTTIVNLLYHFDEKLEWFTKSSFKFNGFYHKLQKHRLTVGGIGIVYAEQSADRDLHKTLLAITANVAHSQDASVLHQVLRDSKVSPINTLHDSYQTTPNNCDQLIKDVKYAFYNNFCDRKILYDIYDQARAMVIARGLDPDETIEYTVDKRKISLQIPKPPEPGTWSPELVKLSKYFLS